MNLVRRIQKNSPAGAGLLNYYNLLVPGLSIIPVINVTPRAVSLQAIPFLDLTFELIQMTVDLIKVVISELTPLFLHPSFELLPISFNSIPIHDFLLVIPVAHEETTQLGRLCSEKRLPRMVENCAWCCYPAR
jgi:hypothetical protein